MASPLSLITPDPDLDEVRRRALRRMRLIALSMLVAAAICFLLTLGRGGWLGFVNTAAEAAMVGGIADWFAVTALFRHPLGIPIPHTALVPKRKDDLGRGLEDFVADNFLQPDIIRERVRHADVPMRLAAWTVERENAQRIVNEFTDLAVIGLAKVRDEHIVEIVDSVLVPRFQEEPIAPILGTFLTEAVADDLHHGLVDLALAELHRWLAENPETFTEVLADRAPWWTPTRLNDAVTGKLYTEVLRWVAEIRDDPRHHARGALDSMLTQLAADLLHDPATAARAEVLKERILTHPQVAATATSLWQALRNALLNSLRDQNGALRERLTHEVRAFAERVQVDAELRERMNQLGADFAVFVTDRYGAELTAVISATIERWDGAEAAEKIELHVGRDLQFIRINGTVVGGLVGLVIHSVSVLLH